MKRTYITAILYGWISAVILLLLMSACLAFMIKFFDVSHSTVFYGSFIIGLFILTISGFVAGAKGKENGWFLGTMVGIGCIGMTYFVQYVGLDASFTLQQILYLVTYVLAAIVGGVAGVNVGNYVK